MDTRNEMIQYLVDRFTNEIQAYSTDQLKNNIDTLLKEEVIDQILDASDWWWVGQEHLFHYSKTLGRSFYRSRLAEGSIEHLKKILREEKRWPLEKK